MTINIGFVVIPPYMELPCFDIYQILVIFFLSCFYMVLFFLLVFNIIFYYLVLAFIKFSGKYSKIFKSNQIFESGKSHAAALMQHNFRTKLLSYN